MERAYPVLKRFVQLTVILTSTIIASTPSHAALVAYWHFNDYDGSSTTVAADSGAGSLSFADFAGDTGSFTGSSINAFGGATAGSDLGLLNQANNGSAMLFQIDTTGLNGVTVTYATRGTATGFSSQTWAYSTDNSVFTEFATISPSTTYSGESVDFTSISALNNQSTVYFRVTLAGATSSSGNNRFDNVQINASPVPEPEHYGLICALGLLGIAAVRKLKKEAEKLKS